MGTALLLSGSRGGFIALIAEVALMLLLSMRSKSRNTLGAKMLLLALVLLMVIIGGSFFVGGKSSTRIAETEGSGGKSIHRAYIWGVTLNIIRANMPFGAGLGAFGVAFTPFDKFSGMMRRTGTQRLSAGRVRRRLDWPRDRSVLFGRSRQNRARGCCGREYFSRGVAIGALSGIFGDPGPQHL